jgi:6-phosphofructokinase 1
VLKAAEMNGDKVIGIHGGWEGLLKEWFKEMTFDDFEDYIGLGGTLLTVSRASNDFHHLILGTPPGAQKEAERDLKRIETNMKKAGIDALVVVGGDGTLGVASRLAERGVRVIGVPKTIDNDIAGTDYSFGFFTAVDEAMRLIESLATTARSHGRVMVVEVMGRDAGWIAAFAGMAAGANIILVPEFEISLESLVKQIKTREKRGKKSAVVVVAEGVDLGNKSDIERDDLGHTLPGVESTASFLAHYIAEKTGVETRSMVLGHTVRGTPPNAYDRIMTTRLGFYAVEALHAGKSGIMVAARGTNIIDVPLMEGAKKKYLDSETWRVAKSFFG